MLFVPALIPQTTSLRNSLFTMGLAYLALFSTSCTDNHTETGNVETGVCDDLDLPPCPEECPEDWAATCGEICKVEGETCGNQIGDGRECVDGLWQCSVHAPVGDADTCNLVCDPEA